MVLRSGCCVFNHANSDLYISNSLGTFRNDHSEIFASPPFAATSAMIGNCNPESDTSPTFFCRMPRSEEHTSELQSPDQLVCRLLLEKKNTLPPLLRRRRAQCILSRTRHPSGTIPGACR